MSDNTGFTGNSDPQKPTGSEPDEFWLACLTAGRCPSFTDLRHMVQARTLIALDDIDAAQGAHHRQASEECAALWAAVLDANEQVQVAVGEPRSDTDADSDGDEGAGLLIGSITVIFFDHHGFEGYEQELARLHVNCDGDCYRTAADAARSIWNLGLAIAPPLSLCFTLVGEPDEEVENCHPAAGESPELQAVRAAYQQLLDVRLASLPLASMGPAIPWQSGDSYKTGF